MRPDDEHFREAAHGPEPVRELRDMLAAFSELRAREECAVLASVVHVSGSTYRRPGARSLLLSDGRAIGLISGGCLESDLLENAAGVRADGRPRLVHYDSSTAGDIIWGLGLGCAGVVDVLLERVDDESPGPLDFLLRCLRGRRRAALATGLRGDSENFALGTRWLLADGGTPEGPGLSTTLGARISGALERALVTDRPQVLRSEEPGSPLEVAIELLNPPTSLVVFGAGPDASPVVRLAIDLGWDVAVVDWRASYARSESFSGAEVIECAVEEVAANVPIECGAVALVMTHHYLNDKALVRWLLGSPVQYIGLLGPRQRSVDLLDELREEGFAPTQEEAERLYAPAGLDLGADAPEQIALAVVAEIQAVLAGRSGGGLRDRVAPIHDPPLGA